jgi:hypothetical protein
MYLYWVFNVLARQLSTGLSRPLFRALSGSVSAIVPVTDGMTLTASWVTRGQGYYEIANAVAASVRVDATISNTDSGILMESGASGTGSIIYVYAGVLYFQCGSGSNFGTASDRAEIAYTLPVGEFDYVVEWSADVTNAVFYVNGSIINSQTFNAVNVSGGDAGTVGEVKSTVAVNRGGWTSDGQGSYTNTITKCDIFNGQVTPDV